jgi:Novel STAND NTPase 1
LGPTQTTVPGLNVFQEEDAGVYFGRESEIVNVLATLTRMRDFGDRGIALVIGASGCGKFSMVRAGVVSRLRKDPAKWLIVPPFRPGDTPLDELAKMLAAAVPASAKHNDPGELKRRLATAPDGLVQIVSELVFAESQLDPAASGIEATGVIVVDQLEEVLNSAGLSDRITFLQALRRASETPRKVLVLATLRSDFLGQFQDQEILRGVEFDDLPLGPLPVDKFSEVIEKAR